MILQIEDLKRKADEIFRINPASFDEPLRRFSARFSHEAIRQFFVERLVRA